MKRFTGLLSRNKSSDSNNFLAASSAPVDSPEANAARSIRLFCESASDANRDEEVLHLPVIVEAAESSPAAAAASAQQIKRFLSRDYATKPAVQYNAIMLVRILSDNPGPTFTRCFDQSFVKTVKELLRGCKDHGTQQILRETLDSVEVNKAYDDGVQGLIAMWRKEKGSMSRLHQPARMSRGPGGYSSGQGYPQNNERITQRNQLPPAHELASRIEEARNTAKILLQLIQQSPPEELVGNELVREFSERCQAAQKSMQVYINCDSPPPDDDTMLTLIETNEQLSLAGSRYQRAVLTARRQLGTAPSGNTSPEAMNDGYGAFTSPPAAGQAESLFRPAPPAKDYAEDSPVSPILQQTHSNGQSQYAPSSNNNAYQVPSGPPPRQERHQHTPSSTSSIYVSNNPQEASNPFLDPIEHSNNPPALAMPPPQSRKPVTEPSPTTYSYGSSSPEKAAPSTESHSPQRPGIGPYHNSGISPSYMGRQASALNGLTMHGADSEGSYTNTAVEIDGQSNVGRSGQGYGDHTVSPVPEERTDRIGRRVSRVDVAGTGGLRDPRM
ncbi:hypothetical protein MBLNU13_g10969t1 [Cladosporium sp. NU13]